MIRLLAAFATGSEAVTVVDLGSGYGGTATKITRQPERTETSNGPRHEGVRVGDRKGSGSALRAVDQRC